jgi:hypothetical protein
LRGNIEKKETLIDDADTEDPVMADIESHKKCLISVEKKVRICRFGAFDIICTVSCVVICIHVCMHTYVYVCVFMYVCVCLCTYNMYTCRCVHTNVFVLKCACIFAFM